MSLLEADLDASSADPAIHRSISESGGAKVMRSAPWPI